MSKNSKGDHVVVISGREKGKQGQVTRLLGDKVVVEGVNLVKRHQKPNPMRNVEGGVVAKNMPIHISNVAIYNKEMQKADRVGVKLIDDNGKVRRVRVFKSNGAELA